MRPTAATFMIPSAENRLEDLIFVESRTSLSGPFKVVFVSPLSLKKKASRRLPCEGSVAQGHW